MMSCVAIGETVYDIIFRNGQPVAARVGGSMLNTAVSLGRCGINVEMISELGDDHVGRLVLDFLNKNGVSTSSIKPVKGFKTPVSLAFLDENGNAHYSFYKNYPDERLNISWPVIGNGDLLLFGSFYSLDQGVRDKLISFTQNAKHNGGMVVYDPNIRKNHLNEIRKLMSRVNENISLADIVRGSDEDFRNLFDLDDPVKIFEKIQSLGCKYLIITRGKEGVDLYNERFNLHVPAKNIEVISTIGAGDAFNAGIIFGIIKNRYNVDDLVNINPDKWKELLGYGINFASEVCGSYDNYIPARF
jgi:fructokinase